MAKITNLTSPGTDKHGLPPLLITLITGEMQLIKEL